jgi:hypothetical protein
VPAPTAGARPHGGWDATNLTTKKKVRIKSAQRLRGEAGKTTRVTAREAAETAKTDERNDRDKDKAPRSELTLEEAAKLEKARAAKAKKTKATDGEKTPKRVSALDAAAQVLKSAGKPMRAQELVAAMAEQGLWTSPAGKTPHATLYAAMTREERDKGSDSRFRKVDRGQFAFTGKEA